MTPADKAAFATGNPGFVCHHLRVTAIYNGYRSQSLPLTHSIGQALRAPCCALLLHVSGRVMNVHETFSRSNLDHSGRDRGAQHHEIVGGSLERRPP